MQNQNATWQDLMHSRMRSLRERHFVTNFILQYSSKQTFFYSFLELNNYNGYVCAIYNCYFTAYIYSLLKVRFKKKKKNHETKNKCKSVMGP